MKSKEFEVWLCCSQWRPDYYAFRGRDCRGRLRVKSFHRSGSYFLRWSLLGVFSSLDDARAVCDRFHSEDPVNNYDFLIREFEVTRRLVSSSSHFIKDR